MRRVLVCGSRNFFDGILLCQELDTLHADDSFTVVIEGEAPGADTLARMWAEARKIPVLKFPANWGLYGRAAGPIRNRQMLVEGKPDLVIAFSFAIDISKGTKNMLTQAQKAGIPTILYGSTPTTI